MACGNHNLFMFFVFVCWMFNSVRQFQRVNTSRDHMSKWTKTCVFTNFRGDFFSLLHGVSIHLNDCTVNLSVFGVKIEKSVRAFIIWFLCGIIWILKTSFFSLYLKCWKIVYMKITFKLTPKFQIFITKEIGASYENGRLSDRDVFIMIIRNHNTSTSFDRSLFQFDVWCAIKMKLTRNWFQMPVDFPCRVMNARIFTKICNHISMSPLLFWWTR